MIDAEKANYPVTFMCDLLGVPRSTFCPAVFRRAISASCIGPCQFFDPNMFGRWAGDRKLRRSLRPWNGRLGAAGTNSYVQTCSARVAGGEPNRWIGSTALVVGQEVDGGAGVDGSARVLVERLRLSLDAQAGSSASMR